MSALRCFFLSRSMYLVYVSNGINTRSTNTRNSVSQQHETDGTAKLHWLFRFVPRHQTKQLFYLSNVVDVYWTWIEHHALCSGPYSIELRPYTLSIVRSFAWHCFFFHWIPQNVLVMWSFYARRSVHFHRNILSIASKQKVRCTRLHS